VARARALLQRLGPNATLAEVEAAKVEIGIYAAAIAVDALRKHGVEAAEALRRAEDYAADVDETPTVAEEGRVGCAIRAA